MLTCTSTLANLWNLLPAFFMTSLRPFRPFFGTFCGTFFGAWAFHLNILLASKSFTRIIVISSNLDAGFFLAHLLLLGSNKDVLYPCCSSHLLWNHYFGTFSCCFAMSLVMLQAHLPMILAWCLRIYGTTLFASFCFSNNLSPFKSSVEP